MENTKKKRRDHETMDRGPADWLSVRTTCSRWSGLGFATRGGWNGWAAGALPGLQGCLKIHLFFLGRCATWKVLGLGSILFREISHCTLESEDTSETEGSEPSNTLWGLSAWGSCGLRRKARSCAKKWLSECNRCGKEMRHGMLDVDKTPCIMAFFRVLFCFHKKLVLTQTMNPLNPFPRIQLRMWTLRNWP